MIRIVAVSPRWCVLIGVCLGLFAVCASPRDAQAQLFGERNFGKPLSVRPKPGTTVGAVGGTERFVRGNRRPSDFIGIDSTDPRAFVGSQRGTATGQVRAATEDLRPQRDVNPAQLNPALPPRRRGQMYLPRLELGFRVIPRPEERLETTLARRLHTLEERFPSVEVDVTDGVATLRGTAGSSEDRRLAEVMVQLEPGIQAVRNELAVSSAAPKSASSSETPVNTELRFPPAEWCRRSPHFCQPAGCRKPAHSPPQPMRRRPAAE